MTWIKDHKEPQSRLRLDIPTPPTSLSPLFTAAHQNPHAIDELLIPHLLDPALPTALAFMIQGAVTANVTPPLYWGGECVVPRNTYLTCMIHATLIGRTFRLLSTSAPAPGGKTEDDIVAAAASLPMELKLLVFAHYQPFQAQRRRVWQDALTPVLIKALMSGSDPAPASRFAAAIIALTCWTSLEAARPPIKGRGSAYVWWNGSFSNEEWGLDRLKEDLLATSQLPRDNWNAGLLMAEMNAHRLGGAVAEYVPLECIMMLDAARQHVHDGGTDWPLRDYTSEEVVTLVLDVLERSTQTVNNSDVKGNWKAYLGYAFKEWENETRGQWGREKKPGRGRGRGRGI
ncbi:hypothetical protein C8F01DRAFT_1165664 [Mycena amicta]|nr:hypothetical protein C8F01DRAFT_1165664 [Mycena amicta]